MFHITESLYSLIIVEVLWVSVNHELSTYSQHKN